MTEHKVDGSTFEHIVCLECGKDNLVEKVDEKIMYCHNTCIHVWLQMFEDNDVKINQVNIEVDDDACDIL